MLVRLSAASDHRFSVGVTPGLSRSRRLPVVVDALVLVESSVECWQGGPGRHRCTRICQLHRWHVDHPCQQRQRKQSVENGAQRKRIPVNCALGTYRASNHQKTYRHTGSEEDYTIYKTTIFVISLVKKAVCWWINDVNWKQFHWFTDIISWTDVLLNLRASQTCITWGGYLLGNKWRWLFKNALKCFCFRRISHEVN